MGLRSTLPVGLAVGRGGDAETTIGESPLFGMAGTAPEVFADPAESPAPSEASPSGAEPCAPATSSALTSSPGSPRSWGCRLLFFFRLAAFFGRSSWPRSLPSSLFFRREGRSISPHLARPRSHLGFKALNLRLRPQPARQTTDAAAPRRGGRPQPSRPVPAPKSQERPGWSRAGVPGPASSARPHLRGRGPVSVRPDGSALPLFSCQPRRQGRELSRVSGGLGRPESSRSWLEPNDTCIHVSFLYYCTHDAASSARMQ